mmetsp:Transcript_12149/g.19055  ORF Transcript_12149/g.19055 Transcript_12149/m.19055 type:complete len:99 (+) Transcript_12149:873-1169(+)
MPIVFLGSISRATLAQNGIFLAQAGYACTLARESTGGVLILKTHRYIMRTTSRKSPDWTVNQVTKLLVSISAGAPNSPEERISNHVFDFAKLLGFLDR